MNHALGSLQPGPRVYDFPYIPRTQCITVMYTYITACMNPAEYHQEPMKEHPTAVPSNKLSARLEHTMSKYGRPQKYYGLADIKLVRFNVYACTFESHPRQLILGKVTALGVL